MNLRARIEMQVPLLLAVVACGLIPTPIPWLAFSLLLVLVPIVTAARMQTAAFGQLLFAVALATPPIVWARLQEEAPRPAVLFTLVVCGLAASRAYIKAPFGGRAMNDTLLLSLFVALGFDSASHWYPLLACAWVIATVGFGFSWDALAQSARKAPKRFAVFCMLVVALTCAGVFGLQGLYALTHRRFERYVLVQTSRTGFSDSVRLDSGAISESAEVVMRVYGPKVDYLRGAVLDSFDGAIWSSSRALEKPKQLTSALTPSRALVRVAAETPSRILFAPAGSAVDAKFPLSAGSYGVVQTVARQPISAWRFAPGHDTDVAPPTSVDLQVLPSIHVRIANLAHSWTEGAHTDAERMAMLGAHLEHDFRYTLTRNPPKGREGRLADFLFTQRAGHCEYFATALAMLARSLGIPARVVTGFRVVEHNPYGGYAVVRAEHAHAWVEAWIASPAEAPVGADATPSTDHKNGAFCTFDATPAVTALAPKTQKGSSAVIEFVRERIASFLAAIAEAPERAAGWLAAIVVFGFALRAFGQWRRKRLGPQAASTRPSALVEVEALLRQLGLVRAPAETLAAFSERLDQSAEQPLAVAFRTYAAARYGAEEPAAAAALAELHGVARARSRRAMQ